MHRDMRTLLMEGELTLKDEGMNKVKCVDGEIKMHNIRNRNKIGTSGAYYILYISDKMGD